MNDGVIPDDPGWGTVLRRSLPSLLLPFFGRRPKPRAGEPPIIGVRTLVLTFVTALVAFVLVLVMIFPLTAATPAPAIVYGLLALGPFNLAAIPWARRRLLSTCPPPSELTGSYLTSLFLSLAFVQSAVLFGFVAAFLAGAVWPYLIGALVTGFGYAAIMPTAGRIRHLDDELSRRGCRHSLRAALYLPAPDPGTETA